MVRIAEAIAVSIRMLVGLPNRVDGLAGACGESIATMIICRSRGCAISPTKEVEAATDRNLGRDRERCAVALLYILLLLRRHICDTAAVAVIGQGDVLLGRIRHSYRVVASAINPQSLRMVERIIILGKCIIKINLDGRSASILRVHIHLQAVCAIPYAAYPFSDDNILMAIFRLYLDHIWIVRCSRCTTVSTGVINIATLSVSGHHPQRTGFSSFKLSGCIGCFVVIQRSFNCIWVSQWVPLTSLRK